MSKCTMFTALVLSSSFVTADVAFAVTALHRLADAHGHSWANYISETEALALAAGRNVEEAVEAASQVYLHRAAQAVVAGTDAQFAYGVGPAMAHATGTGRLAWEAVPSGLLIEVCRPCPARYSRVVAQVVLRPRQYNEAVVRGIEVIEPDLCHPRHMATLLEAVFRVRRLNLLPVCAGELRLHLFAGLPYDCPAVWSTWDPAVLSPVHQLREGWSWYGWSGENGTSELDVWSSLSDYEGGTVADYCVRTGELRLYSSPRDFSRPVPPFSTRYVPVYRVDQEIRYRRIQELQLSDPFMD